MNKCPRCDSEYKEINGKGCFVEYQLYNRTTKDLIIIRGLYDSTIRSYMEIVHNHKVGERVRYDTAFFDSYCDSLKIVGYEITEMRSENYKYFECNCIKSITGEPLGDMFDNEY